MTMTTDVKIKEAISELSPAQKERVVAKIVEMLKSRGYTGCELADMTDISVTMFMVCGQPRFIVPFDLVFEWLGYARKDHAKRALTNNFKECIPVYVEGIPVYDESKGGDYIIMLLGAEESPHRPPGLGSDGERSRRGGQNIETMQQHFFFCERKYGTTVSTTLFY